MAGMNHQQYTTCERCGRMNILVVADMAPELCDDCENGMFDEDGWFEEVMDD